jgi:hypothetical protein
VLDFLRTYEAHLQRTRAYCAKLRELELLEPMQARVESGDGERPIGGFMAVNRAKLRAAPDDKVTELFRTDELELSYLQLYSLRHFRNTLHRAGQRAPAAPSLISMAEGDAADDEEAADRDGNTVH